MSDWLAVLISFLYVFAAIGMAELLRHVRHAGPDFTRKFVHIAVGMWALGTVFLFENRWFAIIPPATFIVLNYISYRQNIFKAMEDADKTNLGTVYFPFAFCIVILTLWDHPQLVVAVLMPLTWGDAMAAVFGKMYRQIPYAVFGQSRTVAGSISMFVFSGLSVYLTLLLISPAVDSLRGLGIAAITALGATITEALSPWGIDNLTIPLVSGVVLYFFLGS
ncbi:MAG: phosphatidate cytidylyltransferase [Chloroflexota bacterium]